MLSDAERDIVRGIVAGGLEARHMSPEIFVRRLDAVPLFAAYAEALGRKISGHLTERLVDSESCLLELAAMHRPALALEFLDACGQPAGGNPSARSNLSAKAGATDAPHTGAGVLAKAISGALLSDGPE